MLNNNNKMYRKPSNDPLTQCFDEGFHPSWSTTPWSSFHGLGLCISSKWKKNCLKFSIAPETHSKLLRMSKYARIHSFKAKIGQILQNLWLNQFFLGKPLQN